VHATRGNLNNLVGVPLTLLAAPLTAEALVVEAGASIPGEIARLRSIVEPTVGVITNVSSGHLEGFGSLDGVLTEKLSLVDGVPLAVVGAEPPELGARARRLARRALVAGTAANADARPAAYGLDPDGKAHLTFEHVEVRLPLVGRHQVENATIALAVGRELGVPPADAAAALASLTLPSGRCEVLRRGDLTVLHDAYNANPGSIAASLATVEAMRGGRPLVVVLGSMLELGPASETLHAAVAEQVMAVEPSVVAVTGLFVPAFAQWAAALGDRLITGDDAASLGERLAARLRGDEFVLVKGSRGVRLEQAIPFLVSE
jgi:UDP-N-acetylmuramoyl-tripeptide--D-alanyl-D-alanine ligase